MNIWCEFEEDKLKTLLCRVHTVNMKLTPWWPQMSVTGDKNGIDLDLGPMKVWCEFEEGGLNCRLHTRKNELGPLVATNVING